MNTLLRIIKYTVALFSISVLFIAIFSYISNEKSPSFTDILGVFTLTATIIGTIFILISIDDWKHQDNRRLEREVALQLSEIIDSQYISFLNLFLHLIHTPISKDTYRYFDYKIYETISAERYQLIADFMTEIANGTHKQELHSSRLIRFTGNKNVQPNYNELYTVVSDLYIAVKYIFDFRAKNDTIIDTDEAFKLYKIHYDSINKLLFELDSKKIIMNKILDDIILIK